MGKVFLKSHSSSSAFQPVLFPQSRHLRSWFRILSINEMATQTTLELEVLDERGAQLISEIPASIHEETKNNEGRPLGPPNQTDTTTILPKGRSIIVTTQLAGINFITSFCNGVLTIALPTMANELSLKPALLLWPSSAYYLTSGATLLIAGAFADAVGARTVNLAGCILLSMFMVANGVAKTGIQLILFRAMQGIASSLVVPTAISIISTSVETGRRRNLAFASLGLAMPLGFSGGLVLGGVFVSGPGWRVGYYIAAALSAVLFIVGIWSLPKGIQHDSETPLRTRLVKEIDWVGAGIASAALALFSYVLAYVTLPFSPNLTIQKSANIHQQHALGKCVEHHTRHPHSLPRPQCYLRSHLHLLDEQTREAGQSRPRFQLHLEENQLHDHLHNGSPFRSRDELPRTLLQSLVSHRTQSKPTFH